MIPEGLKDTLGGKYASPGPHENGNGNGNGNENGSRNGSGDGDGDGTGNGEKEQRTPRSGNEWRFFSAERAAVKMEQMRAVQSFEMASSCAGPGGASLLATRATLPHCLSMKVPSFSGGGSSCWVGLLVGFPFWHGSRRLATPRDARTG